MDIQEKWDRAMDDLGRKLLRRGKMRDKLSFAHATSSDFHRVSCRTCERLPSDGFIEGAPQGLVSSTFADARLR
jgi:hypothetical protein